MGIADRYQPLWLLKQAPKAQAVNISANVNNTRPNVNIALQPLTGKVRMVGVRMTEDEIEAIDAARGKTSRQDFFRKAALWLADQADKLR